MEGMGMADATGILEVAATAPNVKDNAEVQKLAAHFGVGARGVGDEHDPSAPVAKILQRPGGGGKMLLAVDEHAPDVAENRVIAADELVEPADFRNAANDLRQKRDSSKAAA